jgi:hypothetical protein
MGGRLNDLQLTMMRHALGLSDAQKTSYRNHYVAHTKGEQAALWDDLTARGFAVRGSNRKNDLVRFCLTLAGAQAALQPGERLCPEDFPDAGRRALSERGKE